MYIPGQVSWTRHVYDIVEGGRLGHRKGQLFDTFIGLAIVATISETVISTEPWAPPYYFWLQTLEWICASIFAIEYVMRVISCVHDRHGRYSNNWKGRLAYMASPMAVIDLVSFLPTFFLYFIEVNSDVIVLLRCIRFLKLLRYFSALDTLAVVISNERKQLMAAMTLMLILLVIVSTLAHLIEKDAQPEQFGTVLRSMWWGIVTLATVGYGDVVPQTPIGKVLGGVAVVLGMGMFALPAGIVASGFAEEMKRRNFIVTWTLVARVPFFANLPATRIADIAARLESRTVTRGESILVRDDPADSMYFLVEGEVEVLLPGGKIRLEAGEFFGEMALLSKRPRSATVVARTFCQLLRLRVDHFEVLMTEHPDLSAAMNEVVRQRMAQRTPSTTVTDGDVET